MTTVYIYVCFKYDLDRCTTHKLDNVKNLYKWTLIE